MARLVLGNTDASGVGRGWIAPTSKQPRFASFFLGGSPGANMALHETDAIPIGAPTLQAGITGRELPYLVTKGAENYLQTALAEPQEATCFAVARMPDKPGDNPLGATDGLIMGLYDTGNIMMMLTNAGVGGAFRTRIPEAKPEGWNTSPPALVNMTTWGLYALRYQKSGSTLTGLAKAYTCKASTTRTGAVATAVSPSPVMIGSQPFARTSGIQRGVVHHAASMIWDVALSDAEMEAVASLLRRWCARYGVSV